MTEWTWWWQFNREPYLALKEHIRFGDVRSGSAPYDLGAGGDASYELPGQRFVWEAVLPAIERTLLAPSTEGISADELTASMIALAKIMRATPDHQRGQLPRLHKALSRHLTSSNQEVSETAVIALGLAGGQRSALDLGELLLDNEAGRRLLGKTSVPVRTRAFAAYGMALLGAQNENEDLRRLIVHRLIEALEKDQTKSADLQVACVISLGRLPLKLEAHASQTKSASSSGSSSLQAQLAYLLAHLERAELRPLALAQLPISLAYLLPGEGGADEKQLKQQVAQALLDQLAPGPKTTRELQQSVMIALGMVGDDDLDALDVKIRKRLAGAWSDFKDQHTRHMATIALAEVSTRRGSGEHTPTHSAQETLLHKLNSRRGEEVRWAALALGIHGLRRTPIEDPGAPINSSEPSAKRLAKHLRDAKTPLDVGAFATGLGLLGDPAGQEVMQEKLASTTEERALGHVAVGAGLLGLKASIPSLRTWIQSTTYRIFLTQELAISLAMLEDLSVAPLLMERLAEAKSLSSQASLAQALGRVGDQRTLKPLLELYQNQEVSGRARAFAAVALGIVADQDALPWNTLFKLNLNYTATTDTLFNPKGTGVLNIL